jgi:hypothetical protein
MNVPVCNYPPNYCPECPLQRSYFRTVTDRSWPSGVRAAAEFCQMSELIDCQSRSLRMEYQLMDETTLPKARLRGFLFVLPIFAAVGSLWFFFFRDCFFSVPIYDSLFWVIPCLLFLSSTPWFILVVRKLHGQNYVIANENGPGSRSAKSGDVLIFEEKVGPMGARLIDIQRKLN